MANTVLQTITSNPLIQRIAQTAPTWLNVALVLVLGYCLSDLVWAMVPVKDSPQAPAIRSGVNQVAAKQAVFYGAKIANKHIFGQADVTPETSVVKEDLKETRLDLVLRGILAHKPQSKALAMISRGRSQQEVYAIGDSLPGNAELSEIHRDKVIIEYQGRYETLTLEQIKGVALQTNKAPVKRAPRSSSRPAIAPQRAASLRKEFLANPSKLMSMVNIKQQRSDGKLLGYQINPKGDPSLFYELGLQEGDVLLSVNGQPVSNTKALNGLRDANRYDVVVMRGGAEVPLSISFE